MRVSAGALTLFTTCVTGVTAVARISAETPPVFRPCSRCSRSSCSGIPCSRHARPAPRSPLRTLSPCRCWRGDGAGVVVYLDAVGRARPYMPDEADMLRMWDLALALDTDDGAIYRARQSANAEAGIT